jgi:hypothetical protein
MGELDFGLEMLSLLEIVFATLRGYRAVAAVAVAHHLLGMGAAVTSA